MPLPLPSLDDRRWADLVAEGRALIPLHAPEWSDHNLHDPGVTLIELLAWVAEMDLYRLDRVPPKHRRKFLALAGVVPEPPRPSRVAAGFRLGPAALATLLPAGLEIEGEDPFGAVTRFRTREAITAHAGELAAIQSRGGDAAELADLTAAWRRGETLAPLGDDPAPGAALYLGLRLPAGPPAEPLSLYFAVPGDDGSERGQLRAAIREAREACRAPEALRVCGGEKAAAEDGDGGAGEPLVHHSARLAWEARVAGGWHRLDAIDDTRALTLSGRVELTLPAAAAASPLGTVEEALYWLRARLVAGAYDAAPVIAALLLNGVEAEQAVPAAARWRIAPGTVASGPPPAAGEAARMSFALDPEGRLSTLTFGVDGAPPLRILAYHPATAEDAGLLEVEAELLGRGSGEPLQEVELASPPVRGEAFALATLEPGGWRRWRERPDFDASGRADPHFALDRRRGHVRFGDGENGLAVAPGAPIVAVYDSTRGAAGDLAAGRLGKLSTDSHNRALLADFETVAADVAGIEQPLPATGGGDGESLEDAAARAFELAGGSERAVTLADCERLARETPGARLARAEARAELHPGFPCLRAPGVVTVIVVPHLPAHRPSPSPGLLRAVAAHLASRRVLGSRLEVMAPGYREVTVTARVKACAGVDPAALAGRLRAALDAFFHPLSGGPDGGGWPLGRDVYRSEVLQVLDQTEGSEYVLFLELTGPDGEPSCGNLCLPPTALVASGEHRIEVER